MGHFRMDVVITTMSLMAAGLGLSKGWAQSEATAGTASAQSPSEYVFRSNVRRVPIDVVVLDKNGNPVRGLTKDDFVVEEDGRAENVLSFDSFDGTTSAFVPPKIPALPPNTFVDLPTAPERGPLYILYYDMVNTSENDQMLFRGELLKFVDKAAAGTRIALFVNARGLHMIQGFTADHALLREAILRKSPPPSIPDVFLYGNVFGRYDVGAVLSNLNYLAEYLAGLPERKNLIWLSSYFPIPVGPMVSAIDSTLPSSAPQAGSVGGQGGPETLDLSELEAQAIKRTYAAMMRSRVALYPVSLSGVNGSSESFVSGGGDVITDHQNMDTIAASTGGHAFYSDNHPSALIEKAVTHGESYYTLSYSPENMKFDGSERRIRVTLANKDWKYALTYRTIYYAVSDDEVQASHTKEVAQQRFLAAKDADTLYATVEHGAPMVHDLLFVAHLAAVGKPRMATPDEMRQLEDSPAYFRTRKKSQNEKPLMPVNLQQYEVNYDVIDPQLRALALKQQSSELEFAAAAYTGDGTLLNSILNKGAVSSERRPDGKVDNRFHAIQQLAVPPGAAYIRVVVRNPQNDRTGALEVKLPLKQETQTAAANPGKSESN